MIRRQQQHGAFRIRPLFEFNETQQNAKGSAAILRLRENIAG